MEFPANLSTWTPWIDAASVVAVAVGVAKAFDWFDGLISDDSRVALWIYLADLPTDERIDSWATIFPKLIDKVFGERALSIKFFLRSCIASLLAVTACYLLYLRTHYVAPEMAMFEGMGFPHGWTLIRTDSFRVVTYYAIFLNLVPDYCSLLVSRTIVQLMSKVSSSAVILCLLVTDLILTCSLSFIVIEEGFPFVLSQLSSLIAHELWLVNSPFSVILYMSEYSRIDPISLLRMGDSFVWVCFFSAFFTSVWVWLYVLSIFFIKIAHKLRPLWLKMLPYLDIEKKPMQAIGRIAGIIAGIGYAVILGLVWMSHH